MWNNKYLKCFPWTHHLSIHLSFYSFTTGANSKYLPLITQTSPTACRYEMTQNHRYLVADLNKLDKDGEGQAEKNVTDKSPAKAKVSVDRDGRDVAHP